MQIENLLKNIGLDFKVIDELKNTKIIKIAGKLNLCFISQKNNQFLVDRDTFKYLDTNSLPYCFLLYDTSKNRYYNILLRKEANWVKSCFLNCSKDEIYLGKQVLNSEIKLEDLKSQFAKYK